MRDCVRGASLGEQTAWVVRDEDDYVALASAYARRGRRWPAAAAARRRLHRTLDAPLPPPLFDSAAWTRDWERYPPQHTPAPQHTWPSRAYDIRCLGAGRGRENSHPTHKRGFSGRRESSPPTRLNQVAGPGQSPHPTPPAPQPPSTKPAGHLTTRGCQTRSCHQAGHQAGQKHSCHQAGSSDNNTHHQAGHLDNNPRKGRAGGRRVTAPGAC